MGAHNIRFKSVNSTFIEGTHKFKWTIKIVKKLLFGEMTIEMKLKKLHVNELYIVGPSVV